MKNYLIVGLSLAALGAWAQPYSIDWFKIAGGGGVSSNGVYTLSGTIGQHDASTAMSGGDYSVTGGFWSLVSAVQTEGGPLLSITHVDGKVLVSWPSAPSGWSLQQRADLSIGSWSASNFSASDDGTNKIVTLTEPTGILFLRLAK